MKNTEDVSRAVINPEIAAKVYKISQTVRIPFSSLNSNVKDMLSIYATNYVGLNEKDILLKEASKYSIPEGVDRSYLYIFGPSAYKLFLQLIAKENSMICGEWIRTTTEDVLYSGSGANIDNCPTYTLGDSAFWNITDTEYQKVFSSEHIHLVCTETKNTTIGGKTSTTLDVCLYIPYGEQLEFTSAYISVNSNF